MDLFDLIGTLGGVLELSTVVIGLFIIPISEHSYHLKAIKKLFKVYSRNLNKYFVVDACRAKECDIKIGNPDAPLGVSIREHNSIENSIDLDQDKIEEIELNR